VLGVNTSYTVGKTNSWHLWQPCVVPLAEDTTCDFGGNDCSAEAKLSEEEKRLLKSKKYLRGKCFRGCDDCQKNLQQRLEKSGGSSSSEWWLL